MAVFGYAYYTENKNILKLLKVNGIIPEIESVKTGEYVLARPILIYVNENSYKKKHIQDFVRFYLETTKRIILEVGYVPLEDNDYQEEILKL